MDTDVGVNQCNCLFYTVFHLRTLNNVYTYIMYVHIVIYCLFKSVCSHGGMQLYLRFNILNFECTFLYQHRREHQNLTFLS